MATKAEASGTVALTKGEDVVPTITQRYEIWEARRTGQCVGPDGNIEKESEVKQTIVTAWTQAMPSCYLSRLDAY